HQFTGRTVTIPNALLLSQVIINESKAAFVLHTFSLVFPAGAHWKEIEAKLSEACMQECKEYLGDAQRYMKMVGEREGVETPEAHPRISLKINAPDQITYVARIPVPGLRKGKMEQSILRRF